MKTRLTILLVLCVSVLLVSAADRGILPVSTQESGPSASEHQIPLFLNNPEGNPFGRWLFELPPGDDVARTASNRGPIQVIYWDFDDDDGNFTSGAGGSWMWGPPSTPPLARTTNNAWETGGPEDYPPYDCSTLDSPLIEITNSSAFLFFRHHLDSEYYADGGNVQISFDGGQTFELIQPMSGYPFPPPVDVICDEGLDSEVYSGFFEQYETAVFYIGNYNDQYAIIRWVFESDGVNNSQGWIIDNVRVFGARLL